jgi:hypothetical protein
MSRHLLGAVVRDPRSGLQGQVIGIVEWLGQPSTLVIQPPVREDHTVPPTVYVPEAVAEIVPQLNEPPVVQ